MVVMVVIQTEQSCGMLNHMTMLIGSRVGVVWFHVCS